MNLLKWKFVSCDGFAFDGCENAHVACPDPLHWWTRRVDVDLNGNVLP